MKQNKTTAFIHRAVMTLDGERRVATTMLMVVALLAGLSAQAQIYETTYTVINGSSLSGGESCRKLLDGDIHTKWCEFCGTSPIYVEFCSRLPFVPTAYILTTGNDNTLNNYRNPKRWRLYGRLNENEDWTELAYMSKEESMDDKNFAPYEFSLNNPNHMVYQYFKFEVYDVRSYYADYCQLSEFQFKGYNYLDDMMDAVVDIQPIYDYNNGETIPVDFTVKDGLGNTIDPSHYNVTYIPYGEVKVEGEYELRLTGKDGFTGAKYVTFRVMKQLTGAGTEDSPYLINSDADWELFAERVRLGDTYKGKYVKLASDIHVSTMAGSSELYSFQGTFDGDLHTMELNLTAAEDACAPFRYLKDAQVKDLNITGTVSSAYCYAASLAAYGYGTCVITNCGSMATITSTRSGRNKSFHGGFIAVYYPKWSLTFTDCVFAGKMLGEGSYAVGGFVGYSFASVYYNHCLYAATEFTMDDKDSYTFNGNNNYSVFRGAYITTGIDYWYGTKVYDDGTQLGKVEFDYGGKKYCTRASVNIDGIESSYNETGSVIDIQPVVYYDREQLIEGTDYEVTTTPAPVQQAGSYTMTFTGKGNYAGTETRSFKVNYIFTQEGTAEDPYLIPHSGAWDSFVANLNGGTDYTGKYVKLTDDFDNSASPVTTMAGTDKHRFKGVFLGNHRTLTVNLSGSNKYMAPFSYIEDATIQDLTVTGTITSTIEGDGTHGGFAGINNGSSTFRNCTFTGSMLGEATTCSGGFVGWTNGNLTYEDCVFNPAEMTMSSNGSATFNRNGKNTLTRCYYTTAFGEVQGVRVTENANSVHTNEQIEIDGKSYYRMCDISGLTMGYKYTGKPIAVTPIVQFEGQTLTENTDYTVVYKNSSDETVAADNISAIGRYTIIITGIGDYTGTYTAPFYILDKESLAGYLFQKGQDEEGEFYEISSSDDFNALGIFVASADHATSGMRFKLMSDIEVTTMIGTNKDTRSFQGTFDGNGKTLTLNLSGGADDQYLAPFRYTDAATFRNLTVAGTITSTRDGDGTHGGFVGINNGRTTFENCIFSGSLLGEHTHHSGGFVGWNDGYIHYIDCLFAPTEITMNSWESATFNRNGRNDFVRTYYLTPYGERQGTQVFSSEIEGTASRTTTAADGNTYYIILCHVVSSAADWQLLADKVINDELEGFPVVMTADIEVSTSIGTEDHPFRGKFLGNGKTLTVNLSSDEKILAPFRFVEDATFRNLTIAGTITSTVNGDGTCGGFVGVSAGKTIFEKCIFTGSLLGETTNSCGGFVGWNRDDEYQAFTDCLFNPAQITMSSKNSATFSRNFYGIFTRAFFVTPFGEEQGKQAYISQEDVPEGIIATPETLFNGVTYYVDCGLKIDSTIAEGEPGHYYINMPSWGTESYTIPASVKSFKVYDDGGKDGNAFYNCYSDLVLTVPSGSQIRVTGTASLYEYYFDAIAFYDGDKYNARRLAAYSDFSGRPKTIGPVISSGETMAIGFETWDNENKSNVDLTVNVIDLMLYDMQDNDSRITEKLNTTVNTVLRNRKLHKDDKWNTLCLPFALSAEQIAASPLANATILELDTDAGSYDHPTGYENDTLYLNFKAAASIEAGKPYIVKWAFSDSDSIATEIANPFFSDVTILSNQPETVTSSDGKVSLVGTYNPVTFADEDGSILFLGATNTLYYPATNINAFRAYFQLTGITASSESSQGWETVRHVVLQFLGERTITGITPCSAPVSEGVWYDLSGRRLDGKPTQRGIYIRNGKKFVIK